MPDEEVSLADLLVAAGVDLEARFGATGAGRLRHVCDRGLGPVFLPYGWVDVFPADAPAASPQVVIRVDEHAGVSPHPSNPKQHPMVSIVVAGEETIGATQWVSVAHLAHRDCDLCATVWADRATEYDVISQALGDHVGHAHDPFDRWSLFVRTPTDDDKAIALIHIGDTPPDNNATII